MKHFISKQFILFWLILNAILTFNSAGQNPVEPICTSPAVQAFPSFYGDRIVWQDFRYGNLDIFMYDLLTDTESPVCTTSSPQSKPFIWGDKIVWSNRGEDWDIYMYDIPSGITTPICTAAAEQNDPVIYGDIIVWTDSRDGEPDIYMYDLIKGEESPVCTQNGVQSNPVIWGDKIVWEDLRDGNFDIYMFDLTTKKEKPICTDKSDQRNPTIWGKRILWQDNRNGNWDIYMRYLDYFTYSDPPQDLEVFALTHYIDLDYDIPSDQTAPRISGNTVAYQDDRTGISKIYAYHFHNQLWGDVVVVDSLQFEQRYPAVSEERVVWEDLRNGNPDLYMWTRPAGADLAISHRAEPDPVGIYQYLTYTLNIYNHGPMTATDILVQDKPCGGLDMYSINSTLGLCSFDTGVVSCNIDSIPALNYATITIVVMPTAVGRICNKVYVSSPTPDYIQTNNYTCRIVTVDKYLHQKIGAGFHPSIAVDKHKKAHISYTTETPWGDLVYKNNSTGSWIKNIFDNSGRSSLSSITTDKAGNIHLAYAMLQSDQSALTNIRYTNNVNGYWKQEETICQSAKLIKSISLKVDTRDHLHIAYMGPATSEIPEKLIYINDTSGTWTFDTLGNFFNYISMAIDSNNYLHVSGYSGHTVAAYLTNSPDGIWHDLESIEWVGGQLEGMVTSIAIGPDNRPHISYAGGALEDNKYATKTDTGWQITFIDSGGYQSSGNSIAVDSLGNVHIVYHHIPYNWYPGNPMTFKYATNASGAWTKEVIDPDGGMENAIAVDKNGDAHITYASDKGVQYIWKVNGADTDHDGVAGIEEQGPERNDTLYDGNSDGTPDCEQKNVTSLHTNNGSGYVTFAVDNSMLALSDVTAIDNPAPSIAGSPEEAAVPYGFFSFRILGLDVGGSAVVRLYLHGGPHIDAYYKYGPTADTTWHHWYPFIYDGNIGAEISGDTVILHLTDGRRGDHDVAANGIIVEPGGPIQYPFGIREIPGSLPIDYKLFQNYPNPFNPLTKIQFDIPEISNVTLKVYNLLGQEVATLVNEVKKAGCYEYIFDCSAFSSGAYFYRLSAGDYINTKKLILLK